VVPELAGLGALGEADGPAAVPDGLVGATALSTNSRGGGLQPDMPTVPDVSSTARPSDSQNLGLIACATLTTT
jgi:hypothetical protein